MSSSMYKNATAPKSIACCFFSVKDPPLDHLLCSLVLVKL